jgi:hypothetical protein
LLAEAGILPTPMNELIKVYSDYLPKAE